MSKENYAFTWNSAMQESLTAGLEKLTGVDFERAENEERRRGNTSVELTLSKAFQAELAAIALDVPPPQIRALSVKEYLAVTAIVFGFLFDGSARNDSPAESTEKSQSGAPSTAG